MYKVDMQLKQPAANNMTSIFRLEYIGEYQACL